MMREILRRLNHTEPARVRAVWAALSALLASAGIVVSGETDAAVGAGIGLFFALLALVQGEATRARVYSPASVDEISRDLGAEDY